MSRSTHNRSFQRRVFPGNHLTCTGTNYSKQTRENTPKTQNKQTCSSRRLQKHLHQHSTHIKGEVWVIEETPIHLQVLNSQPNKEEGTGK